MALQQSKCRLGPFVDRVQCGLPRSLPPKGPKPRNIYVPDLHIDSIKVKTCDFK
jgi:hypothetical protein